VWVKNGDTVKLYQYSDGSLVAWNEERARYEAHDGDGGYRFYSIFAIETALIESGWTPTE
jgi:hypothetical protein